MKATSTRYILGHPGIFIILALLFLGSCISHKKLHYIQSKEAIASYENTTEQDIRVKPGDELYIRVSSLDEVDYNFFTNQAAVTQQNLTNELSVSLVTFSVNDAGYIDYPVAGEIYVKDLIVDEVADRLQEILKSYFNQPTVTVKKVNKMITVLGEVRSPGHYTFTQQSLNIFEGLGLAGDITINGNKKNVTLLREEAGGKINRWQFDMTSETLLDSPQYYLEPGDVLIVRARKSALWSITASSISLTLTFLTTLIVILTYVQL